MTVRFGRYPLVPLAAVVVATAAACASSLGGDRARQRDWRVRATGRGAGGSGVPHSQAIIFDDYSVRIWPDKYSNESGIGIITIINKLF